ncbi:MAG TPA: ABC transporter substrate-binding protein [Spirochaetota bacterium]|nr:ABC transporter substrate-binding protein [Spirochaetota bacterium]
MTGMKICNCFILVLSLLLSLSSCSGKKRIWIYTSIYKEVIETMREPLQKALPADVEVMWFQSGSENIASKVNAELAAGATRADLILTSDPFWYYELKQEGKLLPYKSPAAKDIPAIYVDPDGAFAGVRLPVMVIGYNSRYFTNEADLPKSWKDLADPRYKRLISMPNPLESGSSFTAVALLQKKYGWDYFDKLRNNDIIAAGGNSSVITRIETRERPLGIVLLENVLKAWDKGSPVRPVYPADGTIPIQSPIAILRDSRNPEAARLAYDWFYTKEAQDAIVRGSMYSLFESAPSPEHARSYAELKSTMMPWSADILALMYADRAAIKSKFSETVLR